MIRAIFKRVVVLLIVAGSGTSCAQPDTSEITGEAVCEDNIGPVLQLLKDNYVYPEKAAKMIEAVKAHQQAGRYDSIENCEQLANQLTSDLYAVSRDKHLRIVYENQERTGPGMTRSSSAKDTGNYGFHAVRILPGNIGYLDLRAFYDARYAEDVAFEAMNRLTSDTDALIIDLRHNGGGSPTMIQLMTSYLFSDEPVHLNTFYWRPSDTYTETWTLETIPGKRRPDLDVYVITSSYTFSAAEEFSYNLKHLDRAVLIGETTGGGAHPGGRMEAAGGFYVWVPQGRAINPVTGTNWEGSGVVPHIETDATEAHLVAYRKALMTLRDQSGGSGHGYYETLIKKLMDNPVALFEE